MTNTYMFGTPNYFFLVAGTTPARLSRIEVGWTGLTFAPSDQFITVKLYVGGGSAGGVADLGLSTFTSQPLEVNASASSAVAYAYELTENCPLVGSWAITPDCTRQTFDFADLGEGGYIAPSDWGVGAICTAYQGDGSGSPAPTNRSGDIEMFTYFTEG